MCPWKLYVAAFNVALLRKQALRSQHIACDILVSDINDLSPHRDVKSD